MPSSLSLIISSFWFKVRSMWLFLSIEHLEAIVGLLTGLISICCVSGNSSEERERKGRAGQWSSHNTHDIYQLDLLSYLGMVCDTLKQIVTSKITDLQITITYVIVLKKFELLWEVWKCDTEIQSEKILLEKWCWSTCSMRGCHKPSICETRNNNKNPTQCLWSAVKQSALKWDKPVGTLFSLRLSCLICKWDHWDLLHERGGWARLRQQSFLNLKRANTKKDDAGGSCTVEETPEWRAEYWSLFQLW